MKIKINRFKPSGKWYEEFELEIDHPPAPAPQNHKEWGSWCYDLHVKIRQAWQDKDDGMIWHHTGLETFPVLLIP